MLTLIKFNENNMKNNYILTKDKILISFFNKNILIKITVFS